MCYTCIIFITYQNRNFCSCILSRVNRGVRRDVVKIKKNSSRRGNEKKDRAVRSFPHKFPTTVRGEE